jgi:hypothetical protein
MGVTVHLLSHKNDPVGLFVGEEKVKVKMAWTGTMSDLVLTSKDEMQRPKKPTRGWIVAVQRRSVIG